MTTFYLVRHGETDWNAQHKLQGHKDTMLNQTGEIQAKELAEMLKDVNFDLAFSSDLLRAKRTAEIIVLEKQLAIETTKELRERNFGKFEGGSTELLTSYQKLVNGLSFQERLKHRMADDIESDEEVITRLFTFLREVAVTHSQKNALITTHSGILRLFLIHTGKFTYEQMDEMRFQNGSYIIFESDGIEFFIKEVVGIEEKKQQKDI